MELTDNHDANGGHNVVPEKEDVCGVTTLMELSRYLAKKKYKKSNRRVGDVRQVLSHLSDAMYQAGGYNLFVMLAKNGKRRAKG